MDERTDVSAPGDDTANERRSYQSVDLVFERHYYDYQLALREVQTGAARRMAAIQERFTDTVGQAQRVWEKSAKEAYDRHVAAFQSSKVDDDADSSDAVKESYREYTRKFREGQDAARKAWADAAETYQRAVVETQNDVRDAWHAAFRDYVSDVRISWGDIVIDNVSPASIWAIAQTMVAAAISANSAGEPGGERPASSAIDRTSGEGEEA